MNFDLCPKRLNAAEDSDEGKGKGDIERSTSVTFIRLAWADGDSTSETGTVVAVSVVFHFTLVPATGPLYPFSSFILIHIKIDGGNHLPTKGVGRIGRECWKLLLEGLLRRVAWLQVGLIHVSLSISTVISHGVADVAFKTGNSNGAECEEGESAE